MWTLAIDGGTSATRAVLLRDDSAAAVARIPIGVRDSARDAGRRTLVASAAAGAVKQALSMADLSPEWIDLWCGCGMLTSNLGLLEIPHVQAPTSMEELARKVQAVVVPELPCTSLMLIPGVRTPATADCPFGEMMRGEECETFGLLALTKAKGPIVCILPGSHAKVVRVDERGRIVAVWTSLSGEFTRSLSEHTVLAGSMPASGLPTSPDPEWFDRGAMMGRSGLMHAAFSVRAAQVLAGATPEQCAAMLVGVVVGADVSEMIDSGVLRDGVEIIVGGANPLRDLYAKELSEVRGNVSGATEEAAASAAAVGATQIARLAKEFVDAT